MGKVIACVNEKGGVAKTTTIKNLSIGLAMEGKKILAVDLDPSANLTKCLGLDPEDETGAIYEIIGKMIECEELEEGYGITKHSEGIDVITSSLFLHQYESRLNAAFQREIVLRRYINTVKDNYDYIFLDCPAGLGIFVTNALFCADALIVPLQPQFLSVEAMQNLFVNVAKVRKLNGTNRKPEIMGLLFAMVRTNTNNDTKIMKELRENYGRSVPFFETYIPLAAKIPESDLARMSVFRYSGKSTAANVYKNLVMEFLKLEKGV